MSIVIAVIVWAIAGIVVMGVCRSLGWYPYYRSIRVELDDPRHPQHREYIHSFYTQKALAIAPAEVECDHEDVFVLTVLWPLGLLIALGWRVMLLADRARTTKTRLRVELEAELAKAKQEIDDLLAGKEK